MTFRNSVGEIYSWPEIANIQITGVSSCFWGKIGQQCQRVKDVNKENTKFLCNSKQRLCCFQCGVDWYYGPIEKVFLYTGRYKLFIFSPLVKGHLSWVCSGRRYLDQFCHRRERHCGLLWWEWDICWCSRCNLLSYLEFLRERVWWSWVSLLPIPTSHEYHSSDGTTWPFAPKNGLCVIPY